MRRDVDARRADHGGVDLPEAGRDPGGPRGRAVERQDAEVLSVERLLNAGHDQVSGLDGSSEFNRIGTVLPGPFPRCRVQREDRRGNGGLVGRQEIGAAREYEVPAQRDRVAQLQRRVCGELPLRVPCGQVDADRPSGARDRHHPACDRRGAEHPRSNRPQLSARVGIEREDLVIVAGHHHHVVDGCRRGETHRDRTPRIASVGLPPDLAVRSIDSQQRGRSGVDVPAAPGVDTVAVHHDVGDPPVEPPSLCAGRRVQPHQRIIDGQDRGSPGSRLGTQLDRIRGVAPQDVNLTRLPTGEEQRQCAEQQGQDNGQDDEPDPSPPLRTGGGHRSGRAILGAGLVHAVQGIAQ